MVPEHVWPQGLALLGFRRRTLEAGIAPDQSRLLAIVKLFQYNQCRVLLISTCTGDPYQGNVMGEFRDFLRREYEQDETAWLENMAKLIEEGRTDELDVDNLHDYLLEMARSDRRQVHSRLGVLISHLLKQSGSLGQVASWQRTIVTRREELGELLQSGVLRNYALADLERAYQYGLRLALSEMGDVNPPFPTTCPWSLEQILGLPGT